MFQAGLRRISEAWHEAIYCRYWQLGDCKFRVYGVVGFTVCRLGLCDALRVQDFGASRPRAKRRPRMPVLVRFNFDSPHVHFGTGVVRFYGCLRDSRRAPETLEPLHRIHQLCKRWSFNTLGCGAVRRPDPQLARGIEPARRVVLVHRGCSSIER